MSSKLGWTCAACTFEHQFPGTRCVMCQSLRTTKEQMIDFIKGKPIPESSKVNSCTVSAKQMLASPTNVTAENTKQPHKEPLKEQVNQPSTKGFFSRPNSGGSSNPYSKKESNSKSMTNAENPYPNNHDRSNSSHPTNEHGSNPSHQQQDAAQMSSNFQVTENNRKRNAEQPNEMSNGLKARPKKVQALLPIPKRSNTGQPAYGQAKPRAVSLPYVPGPVSFDESTLSHWIYPINPKYAKRIYQVEMSKSALLENTLVSLPTGLGKTMIAAVVLYNYYRWFPKGKLVFCAPTLPLVEQQAKAIHDIVGIPVSDTALLTGNVKPEERVALWDNRRLFFCTSQTIENDMKKMAIDASKVVCIVLDEVHKATGEHSYVQVIRLLREAQAKFRLVGLSATPGSKIETVQHVITTLEVSKIECRSNDDPDIQQYMHNREHEIITVEATSLATGIRDDLLELLKAPLKRLQQNGFLKNAGSGATISPYSVLTEQKRFHEGLKTKDPKCNPNLSLVFQEAHKLVSWRELIVSYGLGRLRDSILDTKNDPKFNRLKHLIESEGFKKIWSSVQGAVENTQGGANVEELLVQNPKLLKLKELLNEHFERARAVGTRATETRAIVFSQLRGSVREIVTALDPLQPLVRPSRFVGQGKGSRGKDSTDEGSGITDEMLKGMNQTEQNQVLEKFRDGFYNVLVCTSIGEEGLDIGEVDLIVNFDCLSSPIRMLQRVGRTGRARDGKVISILTKGDETKHRQSKVKERTLIRALKDPKHVLKFAPRVPLFPAHVPVPVLLEKELRSKDDPEFSYSQVGGNCGQRKRRQSGIAHVGSGRKKSRGRVESDKNWNLTEGEDALRRKWFGDIDSQCCVTDASSHHTFPLSLRRRFLKARTMSFSAQTPRDISRYPLGSTLAIARIMQETHGNRYDPRRVPVFKSFLRDEKDIQRIFPVEKSANFSSFLSLLSDTKSRENQVDQQKGTLPAAAVNGGNSLSSEASYKAYESRKQGVNRGCGMESPNEGDRRRMDPEGREEREQKPASRSASSAGNAVRSSKPTENQPAVAVGALPGPQHMKRAPVGHNPYRKAPAAKPHVACPSRSVTTKDSTEVQQVDEAPSARDDLPHTNGARIPQPVCGVASAQVITKVAASSKSVLADSIIQHRAEVATANQELQQLASDQQTACSSVARMRESEAGCGCASKEVIDSHDGFYLPTPPDSSSSEDGDSVNDSHTLKGYSNATGGLPSTVHFQSVGASKCNECPTEKGEGASKPDENQQDDGAVGLATNVASVVIENLPREMEGANRKASQQHDKGENGSHDASQSLRLPTQSSSSCSSEDESDCGIAESRDTHQLDAAVDPSSNETPPAPAPVLKISSGDVVKHLSYRCELSNHLSDCKESASLDNQTPADSHTSSLGADSEIPNLRRGPKAKRVDPFMSQVDVPTDISTTRDASTPAPQMANMHHIEAASQSLIDTPSELFDTPQLEAKEGTGKREDLDDTPAKQSQEREDYVDTVCAVCLSPDSDPSDPIIFCDGHGCNLAVHMKCYSISPKVLDEPEDTPWLCDPCNSQHRMRSANGACRDDERFIKCLCCHESGGPLQKISTKIWTHVYCAQWTTMMGRVGGGDACSICSKGGAVLCGKAGCKLAVHPHCAITSIVRNSGAWTMLQAKLSSSEAPKGDGADDGNSLSLLFCPKDTEEARNISKSMKDAPKVLVIPPDRFTGAATRASGIKAGKGCGARRLTKASAGIVAKAPHPRHGREKSVVMDIHDEPSDGEVRRERKRQQMYRRKLALRFIDDEAAAGSDEDSEGDEAEERELADLEAEENSRSSFINDSSPDQLDRANPGVEGSFSCDSDTLHARLDNERAKRDLFATPFLNRRMQRNSLSPSNAPDSEQGLGRLHFVRSVLEHHRNGGDADEIEDFYKRLGEGEEMEDETP